MDRRYEDNFFLKTKALKQGREMRESGTVLLKLMFGRYQDLTSCVKFT